MLKRYDIVLGHCIGDNFNVHIWAWIGYFICSGREIKLYLFGKELFENRNSACNS